MNWIFFPFVLQTEPSAALGSDLILCCLAISDWLVLESTTISSFWKHWCLKVNDHKVVIDISVGEKRNHHRIFWELNDLDFFLVESKLTTSTSVSFLQNITCQKKWFQAWDGLQCSGDEEVNLQRSEHAVFILIRFWLINWWDVFRCPKIRVLLWCA